jgi:hypothetical protein
MKQNLMSSLYEKALRQVAEQLAGYKSFGDTVDKMRIQMAIFAAPAAVELINRYAGSMASLEDFFTFALSGTGVSAAMAIVTSAKDGKKKDVKDDEDYDLEGKKYIPTATQQRYIDGFDGSIAEQMRSIINMHKRLVEDGVYWGFDAVVLTHENGLYLLTKPLYDDYVTGDATPTQVSYFKRKLLEYLTYIIETVKPVAQGRCGAGAMDIVDLNNLGFMMSYQNKGGKKPLSIPTEIPTCKFSQPNPDKGYVIIERSVDIDSEQGGGGAWPKGVNGAIIAIKEATEPESAYRYQFVTKIHNRIDLPKEWRGKKMNIKVAYVAHASDPVDKLYWSPVQTASLIDVTDEA